MATIIDTPRDRARDDFLNNGLEAQDALALSDQECKICSYHYGEGDAPEHPVRIKVCGHIFGRACIEQYVNGYRSNRNQCPFCRAELYHLPPHAPRDDGEFDHLGDQVFFVMPANAATFVRNPPLHLAAGLGWQQRGTPHDRETNVFSGRARSGGPHGAFGGGSTTSGREEASLGQRRGIINNHNRTNAPVCYNCQQSGHIRRHCPEPTLCFGCGTAGHLIRDCRWANLERPHDSNEQ